MSRTNDIYTKYFTSPIGLLKIIATNDAVTAVKLVSFKEKAENENKSANDMALWLEGYFSGCKESCNLPIDPEGTPFQKKVWRELVKIGYGKTVTYGEIARRIGSPKASRAVGSAVGKNPILIAIPCHRVLGKCGIGGFSALGGVDTKKKLLNIEGIT